MISVGHLFSIIKKQDLGVHIELGDDVKYLIEGGGTTLFQLKLGNSLDFDDVLFVPSLKKNFLTILIMEDKGYAMEFKK